MAREYNKDFLIAVYLSRFFRTVTIEVLELLEKNAIQFYDEVGKTKFRTYASVTPDAIKEYNDGNF